MQGTLLLPLSHNRHRLHKMRHGSPTLTFLQMQQISQLLYQLYHQLHARQGFSGYHRRTCNRGNSTYTFSMVKEKILKILEDYEVSQKEAKFNYTLYSSVYSVWMKFDSRSVPLKINDLKEISMKVCRTLQNSRNGYPKEELDTGLTSGSIAAITISMLYLTILLIIAIFLIHRKHKERNKVGSTPTVSEENWTSKAPIKTSLNTEHEC
uniref:Uncharacterized protein LOC111121669 n=1 Tax=Crassostrea virginica TaxID=6565 RepID=A0A8B8CSD5_CRAVI|nr:uncharacterized protein LOC111121669 [Crassostrea virginica]